MWKALPETLRDPGGRRPLLPDEYEELLEESYGERVTRRLAELDRETGSVELPVPEPPDEPFPRGPRPLPPAADAHVGDVNVIRNVWVVKYDPNLADTDTRFDVSDPYWEFPWGSPTRALRNIWITSGGLLGAKAGLQQAQIGDLVFVMRVRPRRGDHPWLARKTLVGFWFIDSILNYPALSGSGAVTWASEAICMPIRRFDFPVPIDAVRDFDSAFKSVRPFQLQHSFREFEPDEAVAVVRACGLPVEVLTEPNPDRLVPISTGLDLGPPNKVRRRIMNGVAANDHRHRVEVAARNVVLRELKRHRWGVASTERERGPDIGADLWCRARDGSSVKDLRVEVKGLSGSRWWEANLTRNERAAATKATGSDDWVLVIVTNAQSDAPQVTWLSADEVVTVWHTEGGHGTYAGDPRTARGLDRS